MRTLEMPLINCEISFLLKWSRNCILVAGSAIDQNPTFQINDTKLYVPVKTLSTQENIKLLKKLDSGFKRIINRNKYLAKTINQAPNRLQFKILQFNCNRQSRRCNNVSHCGRSKRNGFRFFKRNS